MPNYLYSQHGQQYGPVAGRELQILARKGQLEPDAEVWMEGTTKRFLAKNVRNLFHDHSGVRRATPNSPSLPEPTRFPPILPPESPPVIKVSPRLVRRASKRPRGTPLGKLSAGLLGGLPVACLGNVALSILSLDVLPRGVVNGVSLLALWGGALAMALCADSSVNAWRRLLITSTVLCFAIPASAVILSMRQIQQAHGQGEVIGALIGGSFVSVLLGIAGFFFGAIFLVTWVLLGRKR